MKLGLQLGYWGAQPNPFARLARAGGRTARLRLGVDGRGVGIRRVHARRVDRRAHRTHPPVHRHRADLGAHARVVARCTRSRSTTSPTDASRLGLGVSGPQVVEGWYGQPFGKPLARTREYVDIVRQRLATRGAGRVRRASTTGCPYDGPNSWGLGKPLKFDHAPAARRPADPARRRGPEERRARGRDRRRLAAALLLAVPARGVRRVAAARRSPASRSA